MTYVIEESKVLYQSKDGQKEKAFDVSEWLAAICSHVPNRGEQMVRYYGYHSNVSRGKRKSVTHDRPSVAEPRTVSHRLWKNKTPSPYPRSLMLRHEIETMGFLLSIHPLDR